MQGMAMRSAPWASRDRASLTRAFSSGASWPVTVSYTHLDVYKRQGYIKDNLPLSGQSEDGSPVGVVAELVDYLQGLSLIHI